MPPASDLPPAPATVAEAPAGSAASSGSHVRTGVWLMVASALGFSVMNVFVKLAGATVPTMQIVFVRSLVMAALCYAIVRREGHSPWGVNRPLLFVRGAVGATALSLLYFALPRIPLGDATAIFYMAPVWTALSAVVLLGERTGRVVVGGMAVSLLGVLLIARPSFVFGGGESRLNVLAVVAAVAASMLSGFVYAVVRKLRATDAPTVIIFWLSWIGVAGALPFAASWVAPSPREWAWMLGAGAATFLGQFAMTRGLHALPAGRATSVGYVQVVFAFAWGALVFGTLPDAWSFAGAALVVASVFLVGRSR